MKPVPEHVKCAANVLFETFLVQEGDKGAKRRLRYWLKRYKKAKEGENDRP